MRLRHKVALITGAASGLGAAITERFRAEGAEVIACGLQPLHLQRVASATGAIAHPCDVTDEEQVAAVVEVAANRFGRLDILVNAAGIVHSDNAADIEDQHWQRIIDINLTGTMRLCRRCLPLIIRSGGGAIVNIASVAAFNASAGSASYATSKAGLVAFTRSIANRYGQDRVRANCLCPGWVRTPMSEAEMADLGAGQGLSVDAAFASLTSRIALGRIATPAELAACALFLASDDAAFVTGAALIADGGARTPAAARGV